MLLKLKRSEADVFVAEEMLLGGVRAEQSVFVLDVVGELGVYPALQTLLARLASAHQVHQRLVLITYFAHHFLRVYLERNAEHGDYFGDVLCV